MSTKSNVTPAPAAPVTDQPVTPVIDWMALPVAEVASGYAAATVSEKAYIRRTLDGIRDTATRSALAVDTSTPEGMLAAMATMGTVRDAQARLDVCKAGPTKAAPAPVDLVAMTSRRLVIAEQTYRTMLGQLVPFAQACGIDAEKVIEAADGHLVAEGDDAGRIADANLAHEIALAVVAPLVTKVSGPRGDVAAHIAEWRATVEEGTFATVATLARFQSTVYPNAKGLDGRIAARLFPTDGECNVPSVTPVAATGTRARGVIAS